MALFVQALVSCKGESTTKGGNASGTQSTPQTPVAASDFASSFASAFCAIGPCCQSQGYAFTGSTCETTVTAFMNSAVTAALSEPGVVFDESEGAGCVDAYRKAVMGCTDRTLGDATNTACQNVFHGTVPQGGACTTDSACAEVPGVPYVQCNEGLCAPGGDDFGVSDSVHAMLGEPCTSSCEEDGSGGYGCSSSGSSTSAGPPAGAGGCYRQDGLYCTDAYVCAPLAPVGASCEGFECAIDSYCSLSTGLCTAGVASGPCPTFEECVHTSYCDESTQVCVPLKANGAACNYDSECVSANCMGDTCREWSIADPGTCAGLIGD
ncbi:MAG TPA: Dickkopf N-terminal cysteine-rich domain-containing protein [Polyangiaceae bacterium]|nr:Dickkopf N-terminal cysteine-rich domain-containing protein [Polyangiaceae bacterium]